METMNTFFGALDGISPWWWVAFAFALGALEMATMSFFLIWPALAGLVMAALVTVSPNMSSGVQVMTFAGLSIFLTVLGRHLFNKYGDGGGEVDARLNQRNARFVGRTGKVLEFANGEGLIEIEGMRWRAEWPENADTKVGEPARVTHADGMILQVETVN